MDDKMNDRKRLAISEIAEDFPVFALIFQDGKNYGLFLTAKSQSGMPKFFTIPVTVNDELADEKDGDEADEYGLILAGVGNYAELQIIRNELDEIIRNQIYSEGIHAASSQEMLGRLAKVMNDEYRSDDVIIPYRVELAIISIFEQLLIFRMKYDGDYHPAMPYCVIGGYKKIGEETIRHKALQELKDLYKNKPPSLSECQKFVRKIFALEKKDGYTTEMIPFRWSKKETIK